MKYILLIVTIFSLALFADVKIKKYSSGEMKSKISMKDTKREGLSQGFYKDGTLKYETYFKNDKREGLSKSYYNNKHLKSEQNYTNGLLNGISKKYHKNGKLKSQFNFKDDLPLSGTAYMEDGKEIQ